MNSNLLTILNTLIMLGVAVSAVLAVTAKNYISTVVALGAVGAFMALEFSLLQAPDVAIAEASVGAVLSTAIFIVAINRITKRGGKEK